MAIKEHKLKYGIQTGLLFTTQAGEPLHQLIYLRAIYGRIKKATGINKNIHAFRHTHTSMLLAAGVPNTDVSQRLDHARMSTTMNIYAHCLPKADEKIAEKISAIMFKKS